MRLYPKVIPVISRETIQLLMQDGDIEVEPMRIADAEMDLSAIMREYLTNEERVNQATREALERRGYDYSKFNQVKREMADVRGFKMGDEEIEYVINQMIELLLLRPWNVEEVFAADKQRAPPEDLSAVTRRTPMSTADEIHLRGLGAFASRKAPAPSTSSTTRRSSRSAALAV